MGNINKDKLKSNNVGIGDGTDSDKRLYFKTGTSSDPYLELEASTNKLKFSSTGQTGDEVIITDYGTYTHSQNQPSSTWVIDHPLERYPSVTVVDSAGSVVIGGIFYNSITQLTIFFSGAFSGKAYLN